MSAEEQPCNGFHHAYNPNNRRDYSYQNQTWTACLRNPCPSRDPRRASSGTLRDTPYVGISRDQVTARVRTSRTSSRATSRAPSPEPTTASASVEDIGPSIAIQTPVTFQAELPEETPRPSRTMASTSAMNRTTITAEGETQARNNDADDDVKVAKPPQYDGSPKKFRTWWVQM